MTAVLNPRAPPPLTWSERVLALEEWKDDTLEEGKWMTATAKMRPSLQRLSEGRPAPVDCPFALDRFRFWACLVFFDFPAVWELHWRYHRQTIYYSEEPSTHYPREACRIALASAEMTLLLFNILYPCSLSIERNFVLDNYYEHVVVKMQFYLRLPQTNYWSLLIERETKDFVIIPILGLNWGSGQT